MDTTKRRFNVIDLILVLLLIAAIGSVVTKIMYPDLFKTRSEAVTVSCVLKTDLKSSPYVGSLNVGDSLYMGTDVYFGTVTALSSSKENVLVAQNSAYLSEEEPVYEEVITYNVTVVTKLEISGGSYVLSDNTAVVAGSDIELNTKDTVFNFTIERAIATSEQQNP